MHEEFRAGMSTPSGASGSPALQQYKLWLDKSTVWINTRWAVLGALGFLFCLRVIWAQGWFISAYAWGIYLLSLFVSFLTSQKDPITDTYILPVAGGADPGEYRPFLRKLSEFAFWHQATIATTIALFTTVSQLAVNHRIPYCSSSTFSICPFSGQYFCSTSCSFLQPL